MKIALSQNQEQVLGKLDIEPNPVSFKILLTSLKTILECSQNKKVESLRTWNEPLLSSLWKLDKDEIDLINSELLQSNLDIDDCQFQVQKLLSQDKRKRFAAYYTIDQGTHFMAAMANEFLSRLNKDKIVLADPFLGSGRTLTAAIQKIGIGKIGKVWGVEPLFLPALVAYASLLRVLGGRRDLITVMNGDAFEIVPQLLSPLFQPRIPKADVILTNPPFTRWETLEERYRNYLIKVIGGLGYERYVTRKSISLQTLAMFLSDYMLNVSGLIVSVLPASTFYTIYGEGYKSLLRNNYDVLAILECSSRSSFSEDSGFKEIIIVAKNEEKSNRLTVFTKLNDNASETAMLVMGRCEPNNTVNLFNIHRLPRFLDINWVALFGENKIRNMIVDIFEQGLRNGTLGYWKDVLGHKSIIRGVEMYGPNFFFIPNKYWKIKKENDESVEIENARDKVSLNLKRDFLQKTLRKPSLYDRIITVAVDSYMLAIPPADLDSLPKDLQYYVEFGIKTGTAKPAIGAYGKHWYSHVYNQMSVKKPFGHVFIPDKVDLAFKRRGVFANYSEEKLAASKNFYIIKDESIAKLFVGWFNCTFFISTLILLGRKISGTWTRFLENDYIELPVINANVLGQEATSRISDSLDNMLSEPLPPLWKQLNKEYRHQIDLTIFEAMKIKEPKAVVEKLHQILLNHPFNN